MLAIDGPIWAKEGTPAELLVPPKSEDAVKVAFVCGSADVRSEAPGEPQSMKQRSNAPGRVSRGLPAWLAEQAHLGTTARTTLLVPRVQAGGYVLSAAPWDLEALASMEAKPDYVVQLHLDATGSPWRARLSLIRFIDERELWSNTYSIDDQGAEPATGIVLGRLQEDLLLQLGKLGGVAALAPNPLGISATWYIAMIEHGLTVLCASAEQGKEPSMYGERSILDDLLEAAVENPASAAARMLLLATLANMSKLQPDIVGEYREKIHKLQKERPLAQPNARSASDSIVGSIFAG